MPAGLGLLYADSKKRMTAQAERERGERESRAAEDERDSAAATAAATTAASVSGAATSSIRAEGLLPLEIGTEVFANCSSKAGRMCTGVVLKLRHWPVGSGGGGGGGSGGEAEGKVVGEGDGRQDAQYDVVFDHGGKETLASSALQVYEGMSGDYIRRTFLPQLREGSSSSLSVGEQGQASGAAAEEEL